MSPSSDLQEFVLKRPVNAPLDPAPVYATLREGSPITRVSLWEGRAQPWLVTRWEDARAVLESSSFTPNPDRGAPLVALGGRRTRLARLLSDARRPRSFAVSGGL